MTALICRFPFSKVQTQTKGIFDFTPNGTQLMSVCQSTEI